MKRLSSQDFEDLQRLLALKRHEQPPPGYFERFPNRVLTRIEQAEAVVDLPWWRSLWSDFRAKPVLASAYCLLAAGVSLFALSMVELASGSLQDETLLAANPWPQLTLLPAEDRAEHVGFDRFPNAVSPFFLDGVVGYSSSGPPRFLREEGSGLNLPTFKISY